MFCIRTLLFACYLLVIKNDIKNLTLSFVDEPIIYKAYLISKKTQTLKKDILTITQLTINQDRSLLFEDITNSTFGFKLARLYRTTCIQSIKKRKSTHDAKCIRHSILYKR